MTAQVAAEDMSSCRPDGAALAARCSERENDAHHLRALKSFGYAPRAISGSTARCTRLQCNGTRCHSARHRRDTTIGPPLFFFFFFCKNPTRRAYGLVCMYDSFSTACARAAASEVQVASWCSSSNCFSCFLLEAHFEPYRAKRDEAAVPVAAESSEATHAHRYAAA